MNRHVAMQAAAVGLLKMPNVALVRDAEGEIHLAHRGCAEGRPPGLPWEHVGSGALFDVVIEDELCKLCGGFLNQPVPTEIT